MSRIIRDKIASLGVLYLTLRRSLADILRRAPPLGDPGLNSALADTGIAVIEADFSGEAEVADCVRSVFAFTSGGTVMVCWLQQAGGCSGGVRISGRSRTDPLRPARCPGRRRDCPVRRARRTSRTGSPFSAASVFMPPSLTPDDHHLEALRALRLAFASAVCHRRRSATTCRSRWPLGMWSGSPGLTGSQEYRAGSVAGSPSTLVSQARRSARWSARDLPDHLRETRTRRPA
jgi:hypothetical protein